MTRYARINAIIKLLRQSPQTVESIARHFNGTVSPRQIRSDIDAIKTMGYGNAEHFEKTGAANRKTWHIRQSDYDRSTQRLNRGVLPRVFELKRYQSLEKLNNWSVDERDPIVESTHFYETEANKLLDQRLEIVIQAIDNGRKLLISHVAGDATSVSDGLSLPLVILPIQIIYHRGCFYATSVTDDTQQILTFQIDHLTFGETTDTFDRAAFIVLVESNLRNRFGVTQNIDDQVYDIELRFSSITGRFVSEQFWHHSQQATQIGDDWLITFRCGINRELVGWLFQWMSNVRVIGPPELKTLYDEQLARMLDVASQLPDQPLEYTNAFATIKKEPANR